MASATSLPPAADAEAAARTRALEASLDAMVAAEMNLFHRAESEAILMHVHRWGWRWLVASLFCLPDPQPIRIDLPHTEEQVEMIEEEKRRSTEVGYLEMLAIHHQLATKCLSHYNSMHPGKEYEPAPGWLTQNHFFSQWRQVGSWQLFGSSEAFWLLLLPSWSTDSLLLRARQQT